MRLTKFISRKRRSRLAGASVLLTALLLTGGAYAMFAPANADSAGATADDVAKGRALFLVGCASCHGQNAEGIPTVKGGNYGPSLVGVGAAAVDFQVGTGRMPMAQPGSQALRKRELYSQEEINQLAAFVASLGPGPAIPSADDVNYSSLTPAQIAEGGEFFRTNCTACHNFLGAGGAMPEGKYAPSLTNTSPTHLVEAMKTGPQQMPIFTDEVLKPEQKKEIVGYLKTVGAKPGYGGFALGNIGPVSEGLFAWLVGIGSLVVVAIWIAAHTARSKKKAEA